MWEEPGIADVVCQGLLHVLDPLARVTVRPGAHPRPALRKAVVIDDRRQHVE
jgi:hypothetical protein